MLLILKSLGSWILYTAFKAEITVIAVPSNPTKFCKSLFAWISTLLKNTPKQLNCCELWRKAAVNHDSFSEPLPCLPWVLLSQSSLPACSSPPHWGPEAAHPLMIWKTAAALKPQKNRAVFTCVIQYDKLLYLYICVYWQNNWKRCIIKMYLQTEVAKDSETKDLESNFYETCFL